MFARNRLWKGGTRGRVFPRFFGWPNYKICGLCGQKCHGRCRGWVFSVALLGGGGEFGRPLTDWEWQRVGSLGLLFVK